MPREQTPTYRRQRRNALDLFARSAPGAISAGATPLPGNVRTISLAYDRCEASSPETGSTAEGKRLYAASTIYIPGGARKTHETESEIALSQRQRASARLGSP